MTMTMIPLMMTIGLTFSPAIHLPELLVISFDVINNSLLLTLGSQGWRHARLYMGWPDLILSTIQPPCWRYMTV